MQFCSAAEMRLLDKKTIEECGIPGVVLMENAGRGAALLAEEHFGPLKGRKAAVVCGRGNNGGDGFVIGRIFHGWKMAVRIFLLTSPDKVSGDARVNLEVVKNMGLDVIVITEENQIDRLDLTGSDLVVDAVLGTGLNSEVRGLYRAAIERINLVSAPVLAVDIPSGVDADSGRIWGTAVKADLTATFGLPKTGLLIPPGDILTGCLEVVDIGIPPHVLKEADPGRELIDADSLSGLLTPRDRDGHKGTYGHVLMAAGSTGKTGAAALAARAAVRSGAGLVTLAVPAGLNPILEVKVTEAMTEPLPEDPPGFLSAKAADRVLELTAGKSVLALGPGLGSGTGAEIMMERLVRECDLPLVIDADGLNLLAGKTDCLKQAQKGVVLTPHPGEMARLTGLTTREIAEDRLKSAADFAAAHGVILVLKGYRTVIARPDGRLYMNTTGGPYMASGGMGDVLTGLIAGLAAQKMKLADAARLGVYAHGLAADRWAVEFGPAGLAASDLDSFLPGVWKDLTV